MESNKFYKVFVTRILSNGSPDTGMLLCKEYWYKKAAINAALRMRCIDNCIIDIREYDVTKPNIIAFTDLSVDTGHLVYRNINGVIRLWDEFGEVPMDPETECIARPWRSFPPGTHREEIWHWFEDTFHVSVAKDLMVA